MKFEAALKKYDGESVGGQVIVATGADRICIGRHLDGQFLPDQTIEALAYMEAVDNPPTAHRKKPVEAASARWPENTQELTPEPVIEPEPEPEPQPEPEPPNAPVGKSNPA